MPKQNRRRRGPSAALVLALCCCCLWAAVEAAEAVAVALEAAAAATTAATTTTTIVQPQPGASCDLSTLDNETLNLKPPTSLNKFKLAQNNSIQVFNNNYNSVQPAPRQANTESLAQQWSGQAAFESICGGWENSITSRAFWLLDRSRRALIAKFTYPNKMSFYDHPEAKLTSPIFPSIPLYHSLEDSRYFESCRLHYSLYATIVSQIDVSQVPIQTVVAGSSQPLPSGSSNLLDHLIIDSGVSGRNRQAADKEGEPAVWIQRTIVMPKNNTVPAALPYKIEFSAIPSRVTTAEVAAAHYLVGVAVKNISLSPECFGLRVEQAELVRIGYFERRELELNSDQQQRAGNFVVILDQLERFLQEHRLVLVLSVIALLCFVMVYCTFIGLLARSRTKKNEQMKMKMKTKMKTKTKEKKYNNRQRIYAADKHQREEQIMQKHHLYPISLSLIENVELRENPNYASLAHEREQQNQQRAYQNHVIGPQDQNDDGEYIVQYEPDEWEVDMSKVIVENQIGTGAFGMVFLGQLLSGDGTGQRCAIKTLPTTATLKQRMDFLREASIMKQFNTFHVVKLMGMVSTSNPVYVIMEYMENGDLKSYLRRLRHIHQREQKTLVDGIYLMAAQIADGMAYLASKKFVHRDLAARNCMVGERGVVKIGDFGLTRDIYVNDYYRRGTRGRLPVRWMAPEALLDNIYTSASDVWSYGIVVWEIVTFSAYPYQGLSNDQVIQRVCAGFNMSRPEHCPTKLYKMMQRCWRREPHERPTFCDLVEELLPETEGKLYPNCFYRGRTLLAEESQSQSLAQARCEPDNNSRAESYPMMSDDRKPLVALYPVVH